MKNQENLNVSKLLMPHILWMIGLCTLLQIGIAVEGNHIDTAAMAGLGVVFVYYLWFHAFSKSSRLLKRVRFGRLVAHLAGFLVVNLSFHLHAFILYYTQNPAIKGDDVFFMNQEWFGVLFGMMTFWGLGLLAHVIASVGARGYEELSR